MSALDFSPGVLAGLEIALRHPPPFNNDELASVAALQVLADREPWGIERLLNVQLLTYRGCETVNLEVLGGLPRIWGFTSWSSNLVSVALLPVLAKQVRSVDIRIGQVRDLRPLLELPLTNAALAGNPVDEESFRYVYPELKRRGTMLDPARFPEYLIDEREWALMQEFVARGLRLSAWQASNRTRINAPGQIVHEDPEGRGVGISVRQARRILEAGAAMDEKGFLVEATRLRDADGYVE